VPLSFLVLFASLAVQVTLPPGSEALPLGPSESSVWQANSAESLTGRQQQVRLSQQWVLIRAAPQLRVAEMTAPSGPGLKPVFKERKVGDCVPLAGIEGIRVNSDQRLLLFMRDRRLIGANMEQGCQTRYFERGFYVGRSSDGQLCVNRDMLRSRSGATCSLSRFRELVRGSR
jgi:hypothetical protein